MFHFINGQQKHLNWQHVAQCLLPKNWHIRCQKVELSSLAKAKQYTSNKVQMSLHLCYFLTCYCLQYSAARRVKSFFSYKEHTDTIFSLTISTKVKIGTILKPKKGLFMSPHCPFSLIRFNIIIKN